jgi:hypothetical protein
MWASDIELAKAIADQLVKHLRPQERKNDAPEWLEPPPPKPEPIPKHETYIEMLQRRARDDVRAGRAVSMNALGRSVAKVKKLPRAPGQQQQRQTVFGVGGAELHTPHIVHIRSNCPKNCCSRILFQTNSATISAGPRCVLLHSVPLVVFLGTVRNGRNRQAHPAAWSLGSVWKRFERDKNP